MRIFNQFFSELKEYLQEWFSANRELWLARISEVFGFVSIFIFLFFIWKNYQPDYVKELPRIGNRLLKYFLSVVVFLIVFILLFQNFKTLFSTKEVKQSTPKSQEAPVQKIFFWKP